MFLFKKDREFIISYVIVSDKLRQKGVGYTIRTEKNGEKLNIRNWSEETTDYWNKSWETDDVAVVITNVFENR